MKELPQSLLKSSVSIVIPALNEEEGIVGTIHSIPTQELAELGYSSEIIVVDNASTDNTAQLAREAGARVIHEPRRGYGSALRAGFRAACGDFIVTLDADLTYPAEEVPRLVSLLDSEGIDFLSTNRFVAPEPGAFSLRNLIGNHLLSIVTRLLFRFPFKDSQSGMWVFRRSILDKMVLTSTGMPLSEEIKIEAAYRAKARCREVPIAYNVRAGEVKLRAYSDGLQNLLFLIKKRASLFH